MQHINLITRRGFMDRSMKIGMAAALGSLVNLPLVLKRALAEGRFDDCAAALDTVEDLGHRAGSGNALMLATTQRWFLLTDTGDRAAIERLIADSGLEDKDLYGTSVANERIIWPDLGLLLERASGG